MGCVVCWLLCAAALLARAAANAEVLRVGTYNGIPGQYSSIQAAVNAAQPGDWILVAPGDYKTTGSSAPTRCVGHAGGRADGDAGRDTCGG